MSRILLHDPRPPREVCSALLAEHGHDPILCRDREELCCALGVRRPDVLVYVLGDLPMDLPLLALLRQLAPKLPIILVGGPAGLDARRRIQELKPTYYAALPLEPAELADAVHGALATRQQRMPTL